MADTEKQAIASVYSQAIYSLSLDLNQTELTAAELTEIANLLTIEPGLKVLFESPAITRKQKLQSIENIFANRLSKPVYNLLHILVNKGRLNIFKEIQLDYVDILDKANGKTKGVLTTAIVLDQQQRQAMRSRISEMMDKKVDLVFCVDSNIIGGMVLDIEGKVMDSSISSILKKARKEIILMANKQNFQKAIEV